MLPPPVSPVQVVIVPIPFRGKEEDVVSYSREVCRLIRESGVHCDLDDRDWYTPGWKFNYWELKGVPVRVEVGPRDMEKGGVTVVRRDTGEKMFVEKAKLVDKLKELFSDIQRNLYRRAEERMRNSIKEVENLDELKTVIEERRAAKSYWCGGDACEIAIKEETGGEIRGMEYGNEEAPTGKKCVYCGRDAKYTVYIGKRF